MKVYADQNVVSALRRWHQRPEENAATRVLKEWSKSDRITIAVSILHDREAARLPEEYKRQQQEITELLPKVEFVEDSNLLGFNVQDYGRAGMMVNPVMEDNPITRRLQQIGLDRVDAHHVMLAIRGGCQVFVTCDEDTILKYRAHVEAEFPIRLMLPSELVGEEARKKRVIPETHKPQAGGKASAAVSKSQTDKNTDGEGRSGS